MEHTRRVMVKGGGVVTMRTNVSSSWCGAHRKTNV